MNRVGRERGWPPSGRAQYEALTAPQGALAVGSPEQVATKILYEHELFANTRYVGQMSVGAVAHAAPVPEKADVVAVEDVRVAAFLALDFLTLIETHGCVGLAVSRMLLRQLQASADRIVERTTLSVAGRVYAELLRLARLGDGRTIRPPPVLSALAVRVQSTRETVSRTINALERRGLIRRDADTLTIVAPHRLDEMIV